MNTSSMDQLRTLVANLYLSERPMPGLEAVLQCIDEHAPKEHRAGILSVVHLFMWLGKERLQLERTADGTQHYSSNSMGSVFGVDDVFIQCPFDALISFIIEDNVLLTHAQVIHLLDFLHGVILYNKVSVQRIEAVDGVLVCVDDYSFDRRVPADQDPTLEARRGACLQCTLADEFVGWAFNCFYSMDKAHMLPREGTDEMVIKQYLEGDYIRQCDGRSYDITAVSLTMPEDCDSEASPQYANLD